MRNRGVTGGDAYHRLGGAPLRPFKHQVLAIAKTRPRPYRSTIASYGSTHSPTATEGMAVRRPTT